jgi:hypothetical protein
MQAILRGLFARCAAAALLAVGASCAVAQSAADYTQSVSAGSGAPIGFSFKPVTPAALVDVHYLVNGAGEQDFRMTDTAGSWQKSVGSLPDGTALSYWFTYEKNGPLYDTARYSATVGGAGGGTGGGTGSTSGDGRFPVVFQNATRGVFNDSQIYVYGLGMNAQGQWCYFKPDGTMAPLNPADANAPGHLTKNGINYANYAFPLAQAGNFRMPAYVTGGRFYISVGSPMYIPIANNAWGGPDLGNPSDPNTDVVFDWYEFTYAYQQIPFGGNTSQVDMFGLPLTAELKQDAIGYDQTVGITLTRDQVFAQYAATVAPAFDALASSYRIVAPYKGSFRAGQAQANYLQPVIDQVWNYYAGTPFQLQRLGDVFSGSVVNGRLQFTKNGAGPFSIGKPTTYDVLSCSGALATGSTVELELEAEFCAAFNRGVAMDTSSWAVPASYYGTPAKNDYAMFFHAIGLQHRAYGFAYDDVDDQSSVKILPNANPPSSLTIRVGW